MELLITQDLEPLPLCSSKKEFETPKGLLNSNYQKVVKYNLNNLNSNSIFGIRQRTKSRQYQFTSSIETLLKVSVFLIVLTAIL